MNIKNIIKKLWLLWLVMCLNVPIVYATTPTLAPQFLWDKLIPAMLLDIFGNPLIIGLVLVLVFYILGLALRLSFEIQIIMMFFVFFIVIIPSYMQMLYLPLIWAIGIFIGAFLFYTLFRG